ncbi:gamma-glutamyl-gamma-aminobutyrate hydrolase family protein [Halothermothrix orenii]|uniref:Peptidase C26 n=1 Tax=Halothermothrix orenii (strain H 168 / OCM 544 / DSM 9562) TaxID=373903 RepID=B8D0J8_HALOH|nr:gamma-glutamyl-gamma-aminobutyrate hydrolase family protein [Halothermothrix orenii]ACL70934.1 peptidase C26 [Halothermothrix orenii H 168]
MAVIGITSGQQKNGTECRIPKTYVKAIVRAGGVPLVLPVLTNKDILKKYIELIDGLLLTGGGDPDPRYFYEEPRPGLGEVDPQRDEFEILITGLALNTGLPLLGICRGCQLINIVEGGTLYQDLEKEYPNPLKHNQSSPGKYPFHTVHVKKESWLYSISKMTNFRVNSVHHQAIKEVAPGYKATALAEDGVIEAIEKSGDGFVFGVQWHPEQMVNDSVSLKIFTEFVNRVD